MPFYRNQKCKYCGIEQLAWINIYRPNDFVCKDCSPKIYQYINQDTIKDEYPEDIKEQRDLSEQSG